MLLLPAPTFKPLRVYSDGSGLNSVAALVLQAEGTINFDVFVFANVGEDSENPETLAYRREYIEPFANQHGIKLVERFKTRHGQPDTVYQGVTRENFSMVIPVIFPGQGYGNRSCTQDYKIDVVHKYIRDETDATHAIIGLGFTSDESFRIMKKYPGWVDRDFSRNKKGNWKVSKKRLGYWRLYDFPLIGVKRSDCDAIVRNAGLPPVPKSSCWFCPFTSRSEWISRKVHGDSIYDDAVALEVTVNEKYQRILSRTQHPKASKFVTLHRDGIPLKDVPAQLSLWDTFADQDESCEAGYCGL